MLFQLNPSIPVETPKGKGQATLLIDYGPEHDLYWVTFLDEGGECWTFGNRDIRAQTNLTLGRGKAKVDALQIQRPAIWAQNQSSSN